MQISLKLLNLAILLIYVSIADSQYRGNPNIDDLVAAIATAAINGALPLHRMGNFGNPNRKGDVLRIPILLISSGDLKRKKPIWSNKNGRPRNGRDSLKKDYSPKPKYPTHGLKVIPAPKEFEYEKNELKKNFDKKPNNVVQINSNRYNDRHGDFDDGRDRYEENAVNRGNGRQSDDRFLRNRPNNGYNQNEEGYGRQNERLPLRPSDNWQELPERDVERPAEEMDYVDDRGVDQMPPLKPVVKVPTIVRHVYGGASPLDSGKPTIPPRYLKAVADIPSTSDSSPEKYDNGRDQPVYQPPMSKIPALSDLLPPPDEQGVTYKTEPMVNHKYVNLGDVYRKANSEEPDEEPLPLDDGSDGPLAGYAKDQYDKQLIGTLTKLMQNSKNRSPLNIGGLGGAETTQPIKPITKSTKNYFSGGEMSQTPVRSDSFLSKFPSIFGSGQSSQMSSNPTKSSIPYMSQSQTSSSQSKIPESLLSPFSLNPSTSSQIAGSAGDYLSPLRHDQQVLQPGQVPLLPEVNRKPVSLDLGFDSGTRPLSAYSVFNAVEESA